MAVLDASVDAAPAPTPAAGPKEFAFVSWAGSDGRRACPLATFGSRGPRVLHARLACAEPPRADQPELTNAEELRGAVALVVRGGCTFAHKARLLQRAGARAMLLANNTREEPFAAFTMGESPEELATSEASTAEEIVLPCVMMCLRDVRELFQKFPPSVKTGAVTFEILPPAEAATMAETCLLLRQQQQEAEQAGRGWKAIKRTTTSIMKLLEPQTAPPFSTSSNVLAAQTSVTREKGHPTVLNSESIPSSEATRNLPLFAFVQWATSASSYETHFAPLADFCAAHDGASYFGKLVVCDPLLAHEDPLQNPEQLSGALVLVQRGGCPFPEKLARVQRAGAVAAIMGNDDEKDPDAAFVMSVDHIDAANATLPAVMVSRNVFQQLRDDHDRIGFARMLCLSGEAAEGLLGVSGTSVSFKKLPMPMTKAPGDGEDDKDYNGRLHNLHQACRAGDHGACQRVLSEVEGDSLVRELVCTSCATHRLTALHHACAGGNDNVVELLLKLGAAPDAMDLAMVTPLHVACVYGHSSCARLLLRADGGKAPVPLAFGRDADNEDDGGIATRRSIGGGTALHAAAQAGSAECVELLLTASARVDDVDGHESDLRSGKYRFLGVSFKDVDGRTPLHVACVEAHEECALYLIAANADVNTLDARGRSSMLLACEAANDPEKEAHAMHIIEKLVAAGADMMDPEGVVDDSPSLSTGRLLLDRVESSMLRRDLEISYLRYETGKAHNANQRLEKDNIAMVERLHELEAEVRALKEREAERESHGRELCQLRVQMQTMLQLLSAQQTNFGSPSTASVHPADTLPGQLLASASRNSPLEPEGGDEEASALDAALARDLGKKAFRQRQWALAKTYFQRSLSLLPLPGVQRLLDKTQRLQREKLQDEKQANKAIMLGEASSTTTALSSESKHKVIERFQRLLHAAEPNHLAHASLEREIAKLEALQEGTTEFALACRWLEWLLALPWADPHSGLQNEDLYASKRDVFQQLEMLEHEAKNIHKHLAAKAIQRAFREHFAVHLLTRATAATCIQALARGYNARTQALAKMDLRTKSDNQASVWGPPLDTDSGGMTQTLGMQYATSIDPMLRRKFPHEHRRAELVIGEYFAQTDRHEDGDQSKDASANEFRVVQLVRGGPETQRAVEGEPRASPDYYVWTRWGQRVDAPCESTLSGPYDNVPDAQRRYTKLVRDERSRGSVSIPDADSDPSAGLAKLLDGGQHAALASHLNQQGSPAKSVASA